MRNHTLTLGLLGLLASYITAYDPGYVHFDLEKRNLRAPSPTVARRGSDDTGSWQLGLKNNHYGYFADVGIGTPPQWVSVHVDTGSADTWVPSVGACPGQKRNKTCLVNAFEPQQSKTFIESGKGQLSIKYHDGTIARGDYFVDTIHVAGAEVAGQKMGLGHSTTIPYGVLGLGYHHTVALWRLVGETYDNLPRRMWKQHLIGSVAYSIWLGSVDNPNGSLLFGAVDGSKFLGRLKKLSLIKNKNRNVYDHFKIPLTGITAVSRNDPIFIDRTDDPIPVVLDSGASVSYLPQNITERLWRDAGAVYFPRLKAPMVDCEKRKSKAELRFQFGGPGGPRIAVPVSELVLHSGLTPRDDDLVGDASTWRGRELCQFGIRNSTRVSLVGDTIMRSAYIVYDLVNNEVAMAQALRKPTAEPEVIPFTYYGARIPDLSRGTSM